MPHSADRGKHLAEPPIVLLLNTVFFRGDTAQSAASWNSLLHNVLLGHRSRFLQKLRILSTTIDSLGREFGHAAAEISEVLPSIQEANGNDSTRCTMI